MDASLALCSVQFTDCHLTCIINLKLSAAKLNTRDTLTVRFRLANTGKYTGVEIVQLYVRDHVSSNSLAGEGAESSARFFGQMT